jgi:hypothetical protein
LQHLLQTPTSSGMAAPKKGEQKMKNDFVPKSILLDLI